ncbi:glycosyl hydrolase family 76-domain-containing protein [Phakopsora pachyrhizi]|uniref:Mannan endo-1,6-alpha-mannosidase n=1 Tax=Phakopsora pachyrhizi TaxID=170000 RepID=A0AAV0B7C1_PHAPC|nr:glycosyl hydrolase family 76-domain-containing protein [Phakopsora pachyrhizi]
MRFLFELTISAVCFTYSQAATYSPTLDIKNLDQLQDATTKAIKNLMSYYTPSVTGVFDQVETPWHESGMIWGLHFDYVNGLGTLNFFLSDFLGGDQVKIVETLLGRWNDDILWPSQLYGPNALMARSNGDWITLAARTLIKQLLKRITSVSRDRTSAGGNYKSLITQLEFISQGARNYIQTKNSTILEQSKKVLDWVVSSGLANPQTGVLFDGAETDDCKKFTTFIWSYNYGQLLGSLAWMNLATGDQKYLDMAGPYFNYAMNTFAATNTSGVITEICEATMSCNRDQQGFKGIFARNLAYFYRQTNDEKIKTSIRNSIDASVNAMVSRSCDRDWNCGGNWTTDTQPIKYVRSQQVSTSLLVSALGIYSNPDSGLIPKLNVRSTEQNRSSAAFNSVSAGRRVEASRSILLLFVVLFLAFSINL